MNIIGKNNEHLGEIDENHWKSMNIMEKSLNTMEKYIEQTNRQQKIDEHFAEIDETRETSTNMNEPMEDHEEIDGHLGEITENHGK